MDTVGWKSKFHFCEPPQICLPLHLNVSSQLLAPEWAQNAAVEK